MKYVSFDYNDGEHTRSGLRWTLSDVFRQYSQIDLNFYGKRINVSDQTLSIKTQWNLKWTCTRSGRGCSTPHSVVHRSGASRFVLKKTDGIFRLIAQQGVRFLGTLTPGRRIN